MMITIYGFDFSTRSNRVKMCANALDIPFEFVAINLAEGEHKKPEHMMRHPAGKIPVIDDNGYFLFESNAIMKYLCKKNNSNYYPADFEAQIQVDQWCDFIAQHIEINMLKLVFNKVVAPKLNFDVDETSLREGKEFLDRYLPVIDSQLEKNQFIAGDELTIADFCLLSSLDPAEIGELDLSPYSKITAWRENLRQQEFYLKSHQFFGENVSM